MTKLVERHSLLKFAMNFSDKYVYIFIGDSKIVIGTKKNYILEKTELILPLSKHLSTHTRKLHTGMNDSIPEAALRL